MQPILARKIKVETKCVDCGKIRVLSKKIKARPCLSCSAKRRGNNGNGYKLGHEQYNTGRTHFKLGNIPANWKGDAVGYTALHDWVRRCLGKPKRCVDCGAIEERVYQWSNISGEYRRVLSDWRQLCVPCHKIYDLKRIREGGKTYGQQYLNG